MARTKPRLGREDWVALGLSQLARHGPEALTLERVTAAAGKTRGSFYHHFEDHAAFLAALAERWSADDASIIAQAEADTLKGKRRETLARRTADIDHALERELRRLAASEPIIAEAVAASDARRISYLVRIFRAELGLAADEALARARIQHCFFVGLQGVFPDADARFRLRLQATLGATLWQKP